MPTPAPKKRAPAKSSAQPEAAKPKKVIRGSYAIIGPATRARILDAALKCILKHGYHGTTTLLVQKMAGVSRGSLLNQFPTKADLMVALSEEILRERAASYVSVYAEVDDRWRRFELMMDIQWDLFKQPGGIARLEITVAAISDPELKRRFEPQNRAMDAELRERTWRAATHIGITDRTALDHVITQSMAALRGLAIDLLYPRPGCDPEAAFQLIKRTHMDAIAALVAASGGKVPNPRKKMGAAG
jgi:AcrR family transcriptional regulator